MAHTFLFQEGIWHAKGVYIDEDGRILAVEGKSEIRHKQKLWVNESWMHGFCNPSLEFYNCYEIVPFGANQDFTTWRSSNPAIGILLGKFIVVEDSILSVFISEDKQYNGAEYLQKMNGGNFYANRGTLMMGDKKLSSWAVELRKI